MQDSTKIALFKGKEIRKTIYKNEKKEGMGRMDKVTKMQSETHPQQLTAQKLLENPEMMDKLTKLGAFQEDKEGKYPIRLAAAEIVLGS